MKPILTLDYEIFFGQKVGTPQVSMVTATNKLLETLDQFKAKAVFFVDATYLLALKSNMLSHPTLQKDYSDIIHHIQFLENCGHQIQLHIHPHWVNSRFTDEGWHIAIDRFRLFDWSPCEAADIIKQSTTELNSHLNHKVFAFRAGGWCIQPFSHISKALSSNGITLDSTVFQGGCANSSSHSFDFTSAPGLDSWWFHHDPCIPDKDGVFYEVPISSQVVSPLFFWKFAATKFFGNKSKHRCFGDGVAIKNSKKDTLRMLTRSSSSVVSVDGYKSSLLLDGYKKAERSGTKNFVVIGHPKALSEFSLSNITNWLSYIQSQGQSLGLFSKPNPIHHLPTSTN